MSENTQIGPNTVAEAVVWAYCDAGRFEPNVARATEGLRARRDAMETALRAHFPEGSRWTTPQGGYFFWVGLPDGIDTTAALPARRRAGRPLCPGSRLLRRRGGRSSMRLAFSACATDQIDEGIARLGALLASRRPAAVV